MEISIGSILERKLDEPQYVYVETKKLNTYFIKK